MRKFQLYLLLLTFLAPFLNSCDLDTAVGCITGVKPVLMEKEFIDGQREFPYFDEVSVEVENAADNDYFIERVDVDGSFPYGLTYSVSGNTITLTGTPNIAGTYEFELTAFVRPYVYEDNGSSYALTGLVMHTPSISIKKLPSPLSSSSKKTHNLCKYHYNYYLIFTIET